VKRSADDRVGGLAAEVAFFAVLSLFPGLLVLAAALGSLDSLAGEAVAQRAETLVLHSLGAVLTDRATGVIDTARDLFARQRRGVLTSAVLLGAWTLWSGFAAVIRALDLAYGLRERRSWINLRLTSLALAALSVVMLTSVLGIVVLGPLLGHGRGFAARLGYGRAYIFAWDWLRAPIAFTLLIVWAATLYHLAPNHRDPWRHGLPGALAAALLGLGASLGFSAYLRLAGGMNQVFGVLGGGLILLVWLYLMSLALLLGGELNALLSRRAREPI
jgi:membrane protein